MKHIILKFFKLSSKIKIQAQPSAILLGLKHNHKNHLVIPLKQQWDPGTNLSTNEVTHNITDINKINMFKTLKSETTREKFE